MTHRARPKTAFARLDELQNDYPLLELQTKIGHSIAAPGLKVYLEKMSDQSPSTEDRAKALELLTSMELSEELMQSVNSTQLTSTPLFNKPLRCKTAIQSTQQREKASVAPFSSGNLFNPYETSYQNQFPQRRMDFVTGKRPISTKYSFIPPTPSNLEFKPPITSTYAAEFNGKINNKEVPYNRTGSSSGTRNNNPHPSEEFMKWRFPRRPLGRDSTGGSAGSAEWMSPDQVISNNTATITNDDFDRAIRGKYQSIYQVDFTGLQPGNFINSHFDQNGPNYSHPQAVGGGSTEAALQSVCQMTYRDPASFSNVTRKMLHQPPTNRFGCNPQKTVHNRGILPLVNPVQLSVLGRTTYDTDVNERANELYMNCSNIRTLARSNAINSLQASLRNATPSEKQGLETLVKTMEASNQQEVDWTLLQPDYDLLHRKRCGLSKPPSIPLPLQRPMWISSWPGPTT